MLFCVLSLAVALMDSLDSTFDKDTGKPFDPRPSEVVVEGDERELINDEADHNEKRVEDNDTLASGGLSVPINDVRNDFISTTMLIEDDGSEDKIMDTTMRGVVGKTASGKSLYRSIFS